MKKVLLIILSLIMIFSLAACNSGASDAEAETRAADDKSWPTKSDASVMKGVPEFSDEADKVTVEKTSISTNSDKDITYSEIVYIYYENETYENMTWYAYGLVQDGFEMDEEAFSELAGGKAYWASIAGSAANEVTDYSKPFVELIYDESAEYKFTIKICWL